MLEASFEDERKAAKNRMKVAEEKAAANKSEESKVNVDVISQMILLDEALQEYHDESCERHQARPFYLPML